MPINKNFKVSKSNKLNNANFADFSLSSYRVFLNLLSKLQRYDLDGDLMSIEISNRTCSLSATDYANEFNISNNKAYGILKIAVDHLLKTSYSISHDDEDIIKINVCSQAYYRKSLGRIDIRFTEEIMPHISGLSKKFTMYHLNDIIGFNSIYTTRLYELLMQYKTTGILEITIDKLRFALGCINVLNQYNHFKKRALLHAVNEINTQFNIDIKYTEIKNSRKIELIIFSFKKINLIQTYDVIKEKYRTQVSKYKRITN